MFGLGTPELIVIFLVVLLLFGAKKLPEIARSLGQSVGAFKKSIQDVQDEAKAITDESNSSPKREDS